MDQNQLHQELIAKLSSAWTGLPDKPSETPESTLNTLWYFAGSLPLTEGPFPNLDKSAVARLQELVSRRIAGEPLAYLIGHQTFLGLELLASPEAMIPREETEILGKAALEILKGIVAEHSFATVIDLCTGSGNIALALAAYESNCRVIGSDLSEASTGLAERNAQKLELTSRVSFRTGDFLAPFETKECFGTVDLITCNPPYISSARVTKMPAEIVDFEPHLAFDGGPFGIKLLHRLVKEAPRFLRPGGWVVCETGLGQGEAMAGMFRKSPDYDQVRTYNDDQGHVRVLAAQCKTAAQ